MTCLLLTAKVVQYVFEAITFQVLPSICLVLNLHPKLLFRSVYLFVGLRFIVGVS